MNFLEKIKLHYDGEAQALVIGYTKILVTIRLTHEGKFEVAVSCDLPE